MNTSNNQRMKKTVYIKCGAEVVVRAQMICWFAQNHHKIGDLFLRSCAWAHASASAVMATWPMTTMGTSSFQQQAIAKPRTTTATTKTTPYKSKKKKRKKKKPKSNFLENFSNTFCCDHEGAFGALGRPERIRVFSKYNIFIRCVCVHVRAPKTRVQNNFRVFRVRDPW